MEPHQYKPELIREFCAQWHNFFDFNAPTCLRLRPIISPRHALRNKSRLARNVDKIQEVVKYEIECVDSRTAAIGEQFDFSERLSRSSEYTAFLLAAKLLQQGHHEQYLASLEATFASIIGSEGHLVPDKNRLFKCFSNDMETLDIQNLSKPIEFSTFFCVEKRASVRAPGFQILGLSHLPPPVAESFQAEASLNNLLECKFLLRKTVSIDENTAVEEALKNLGDSGKNDVLGKQRANIGIGDLYRKVVVSNGDIVARFNWLDHRLYFLGLNLQKSQFKRYQDGIESESFQSIVKCYSEATQAARNRDMNTAFSELVSGVDWLFKPVSVFRKEKYVSKLFIEYGARFMAIEASHNIFENCFSDYRRIAEETMQDLKGSDGKEFYRAIRSRLPESYLKYRVLNSAKLISRFAENMPSFRDNWTNYATRFFFDFTHIICFRNAFAHEGSIFAEKFYITELSKLYRSIIAFRLACADALRKLENVEKNMFSKFESPDDACFSFCFSLMLLDTEFNEQRSVWLNSESIQIIHKAGWARWGAFRLDELIKKNIHLLEFLSTTQYTPTPIDFRSADRIKLL
jgi:hypothetical protein